MKAEEGELTGKVIEAAIEVHRNMGPGLLESVYERCLSHELTVRGIEHARQMALPITYKGIALGDDFRLDIVVPGQLILELKSVDALLPIHEAQLLTYLKLSGIKLGLLINFNVSLLKNGIRRMIN